MLNIRKASTTLSITVNRTITFRGMLVGATIWERLRPRCALLGLLGSLGLSSCQDTEPEKQGSAEQPQRPDESALGQMANPNREAEWAKIDDAAADGWESEVLAGEAKVQLEKLAALLLGGEPATCEDLAPILDPQFKGTRLTPADPVEVFEDSAVRVERGEEKLTQARDFTTAFNEVVNEFQGAVDSQFKIKVVQVEVQREKAAGSPVFTTEQFVSLSGHTTHGVVEHHAQWIAHWIRRAENPPALSQLEVGNFERSRTVQPWFADCTKSVLAQNSSYATQILRGMNHWLQRIPYRAALNRMGTPGLAVGDINADGLDDLYLCQEPGLPNLLFLQQSDGTVRDVSKAWGVDWLQDSRSALLADFDNDGREDLAVAIFGGVLLARNEGSRFDIQTVLPTSESTTTLSAADYDRDGKLDLYVCAYTPDRGLDSGPQALGPLGGRFVFHDAQNGSPNTLFRNETDDKKWQFRDVTTSTGMSADNTRWSFAATWDDFDNDGDPDLYVANDYGRNCLYRNNQSADGTIQFNNVAPEAKAEDSASGMSAAWADYDRDGWMDLYVGNMFSAAGSRITRQAKFQAGISDPLRQKFQHFARGNTLFRNLGDPDAPKFQDTTKATGVAVGRWAWSSLFGDLNNDGWDDLLVANGYITADEGGGDL